MGIRLLIGDSMKEYQGLAVGTLIAFVVLIALVVTALNNHNNALLYGECLKNQERIAMILANAIERDKRFTSYSIPDCRK